MIWFTSDTHFNHANIIKYCDRPFGSVREMDQQIVETFNKYVKPDDTLYHLGDICFDRRKNWLHSARQYLSSINCDNIKIIWGNHDQKEARDSQRLLTLAHYYYCADFLDTKINGQRITLCHYAMAIWNKSHRNAWHLYGHSHAGAEDYLDKAFPNRKSMDVGVDNAYRLLGEYRPFSFDEIKGIMNSKTGSKIDHHM